MSEEYVILVDEKDQEIGLMEKIEAHEKALLHRAFSVFIFDTNGRFLLQRRALSKYHSGGLWTNACCSHPRSGESTIDAAKRRLKEELGFTTDVEEQFSFIYKSVLDKGLTEHELDHVFFGTFEGDIKPDPNEVMETKYIALDELQKDMNKHPDHYTEWFKICFNEVLEKLR